MNVSNVSNASTTKVWRAEQATRLLAQLSRPGRSRCPYAQITVVADLKGLGLAHLRPTVIAAIKRLTALETRHYPDRT